MMAAPFGVTRGIGGPHVRVPFCGERPACHRGDSSAGRAICAR